MTKVSCVIDLILEYLLQVTTRGESKKGKGWWEKRQTIPGTLFPTNPGGWFWFSESNRKWLLKLRFIILNIKSALPSMGLSPMALAQSFCEYA
jgi:hypothetical protein